MKILDLFGKGTQGKENADKELYVKLCAEEFSRRPYEKEDLKDGMYVVNQSIGGYWKPRFLVDERNKKEYIEKYNDYEVTDSPIYASLYTSKEKNYAYPIISIWVSGE